MFLSKKKMFSWINTAHEAIGSATAGFFFDLDANKEAVTSLEYAGGLWNVLPSKGRGWARLLEMLLEEENFYVVSCNTVLESKQSELAALGLLERVEARRQEVFGGGAVAPLFSQEAVSFPVVHTMHFSVMPRLVTDEVFWKNVFWRLLVLSDLSDLSVAAEVAVLLTHEPHPVAETAARRRNVGLGNDKLKGALANEVRRIEAESAWVEAKVTEISETIRNATSCLCTLKGVRNKSGQSELVQSLVDSCAFHKTKVGSLLGELAAHPVEALLGTTLSPIEQCGVVYKQLLDLNADLKDALVPLEPSNVPTVSTDDGFVLPTESDDFDNISTPSPTTQVGETTQSLMSGGEDEFNAKLPWDDEDP